MRVETLLEELFFTTVQIHTVNHFGIQGSGTGFIFSIDRAGGTAYFLVTNKHVIANTAQGRLTFHQSREGKPHIGNPFHLRFEERDWQSIWFGHPDPEIDIAVTPLVPLMENIRSNSGKEIFFKAIPESFIPTQHQWNDFDAVETITFIGYPNGIWDSKAFLPVARRGTAASPLEVDFEGAPKFIIDASVFGGSSGSPVFVLRTGAYTDRNGSTVAGGNRAYFVGVVAAVFQRKDNNQVVALPIPTNVVPVVEHTELLDLGIVFKARTVKETVVRFLDQFALQP